MISLSSVPNAFQKPYGASRKEKKPQQEAKLMNQQQQVEDPRFVMVVRGQR